MSITIAALLLRVARETEGDVAPAIPCPLAYTDACRVGGRACTLKAALSECGIARNKELQAHIVRAASERQLRGDPLFLGNRVRDIVFEHATPLLGEHSVRLNWRTGLENYIRSGKHWDPVQSPDATHA